MFFEINPASSVPIYSQIKAHIKRSISSGLLPVESKLPSVREMAVQLRVNPNTVAKAYRELEWEGVLFSRKGQGTFVNADQPVVSREEHEATIGRMIEDVLVNAFSLGLKDEDIRRILDEKIGHHDGKDEK